MKASHLDGQKETSIMIVPWLFKANKLSKLLGMKYYVIYMNGSLKVVPKRTIRELVAKHRFRKGVKVADIERRAIYVTH